MCSTNIFAIVGICLALACLVAAHLANENTPITMAIKADNEVASAQVTFNLAATHASLKAWCTDYPKSPLCPGN